MVLGWLQNRRRRRLRERPFPDAWEQWLWGNFGIWLRLPGASRAELRRLTQVFVAEKTFEGCGGFEVTDEVRVTIAAQACLLILGLDHEYYRRVTNILVYPSTYMVPENELHGGGYEVEGASPILGLAVEGGVVVLSWDAVLEGGRNEADGHNLVFHEFAHKLDGQDGWVEGVPPLRSRREAARWDRVTKAEFEALQQDVDEDRETLLDPYGATNEAEFFAVATESFFEVPVALRKEHRELYEVLSGYYRQDPASWCDAGAGQDQ